MNLIKNVPPVQGTRSNAVVGETGEAVNFFMQIVRARSNLEYLCFS